jgi:lysyl-tRNA synthetase class 2
MLEKARAFFKERAVIEVDCPLLLSSASIDAHIDLISCSASGKTRYLHSSPEYCMKRLLAEGVGDIYQLGHVFRDFEEGRRHNPEFTMAEWYRLGFSFEEMIEETCDFISLFTGPIKREIKSYRDVFVEHTGIDPYQISVADLQQWLLDRGHTVSFNPETDTKDDLLSYMLSTFVEPHLGKEVLTVVPYFPPSQAALAKVRTVDGMLVSERFEVFYEGIELANGYHELQDVKEQRTRFLEANSMRVKMGKNALPIDEQFLQALERGLPDCCGVAVGFDRLMMIYLKTKSISDVLPWDWATS